MIHPRLAEPSFLTFLVSYIVVRPSLYLFPNEAYGSAAPPSDPRGSRRDASFQSHHLVGTLCCPSSPSDPHSSNPFLRRSILPDTVACRKLRATRSISNWD